MMILFVEAAVDDLPGVSQRMSAGVDERFVFQMFVLMTAHRIDHKERADDRAAALGDDLIDVGEVLPNFRCRVLE